MLIATQLIARQTPTFNGIWSLATAQLVDLRFFAPDLGNL